MLTKKYRKATSVHDIALGGAYLSGDHKAQNDLAQIGTEFGQIVTTHKLDPLLSETIALEQIPMALAELKQGSSRGKKVAKII